MYMYTYTIVYLLLLLLDLDEGEAVEAINPSVINTKLVQVATEFNLKNR